MPAPRIAVRDATKIFALNGRAVAALDGMQLEVADGEFVCLVGPSGCGKSTLLRIVAGLEAISSGSVEVRRTDLSRPLTAVIFQEQSAFPWLRVRDNVAYGLRMQGRPRAEARRRAEAEAREVGLEAFLDAYPFQLSGGMRQRVAIARAFAIDSEILLMDEPFAALDEQTKILLQEELLRRWSASGKTVLFITHSIDEAVILGDRVVVMTARPGRAKAEFRIDLPRPREVYRMKADPRFGELALAVWRELRDEVLRAKEAETRIPTSLGA